MAAEAGHGRVASGDHDRFATRTRLNHEAMFAFIAAVSVLGLVFIVAHLVQRAAKRWGRDETPNSGRFVTLWRCALESVLALTKLLTQCFRKIRGASIRKVPALPSMGHAVVTVLYLVANLVLTFTNTDENMTMMSNMASRTGW